VRILVVVARKVFHALARMMIVFGNVLYPTAESRAAARADAPEPPPYGDIPPGHPERMPADPSPTAVERVLWSQLQDGERRDPRGEP
jgi:hypothetical protein